MTSKNEKHITVSDFIDADCISCIPLFAEMIFENDIISDKEKKKFRNKFLYEYLLNKELQIFYEDSYIYFYKFKLLGIFRSREDIDPKYHGSKLLCVKITHNPVYAYLL